MFFSIHASAKEATLTSAVVYLLQSFSIHASAKEATWYMAGSTKYRYFSIHASAKEATASEGQKLRRSLIFNPRLREGGDFMSGGRTRFLPFQSTPPRRRRRCSGAKRICRTFFNPRLREGGDICPPFMCLCIILFQSTPPRRRRRQMILCTLCSVQIFNPRLREGGDNNEDLVDFIRDLIFNPRLREGGDV